MFPPVPMLGKVLYNIVTVQEYQENKLKMHTVFHLFTVGATCFDLNCHRQVSQQIIWLWKYLVVLLQFLTMAI